MDMQVSKVTKQHIKQTIKMLKELGISTFEIQTEVFLDEDAGTRSLGVEVGALDLNYDAIVSALKNAGFRQAPKGGACFKHPKIKDGEVWLDNMVPWGTTINVCQLYPR